MTAEQKLEALQGLRLRGLLGGVSAASSFSELHPLISAFYARKTYRISHIGMCRSNGVPIKKSIYRRTEDDLGIPIDQCPDEGKWAIFLESEARMRPFDLLTHRFAAVDDGPLFGYREMLRAHGLPEAMVIPIFIRDTFVVVAAVFPKGDYASQADRVLHEIYQLIVTVFDRFPTLTKWPDESRLSRREAEVLQHTAAGLNEAEIAKTLKISKHTVRKHVENCKKKLDARNKPHAVSIGLSQREIS